MGASTVRKVFGYVDDFLVVNEKEEGYTARALFFDVFNKCRGGLTCTFVEQKKEFGSSWVCGWAWGMHTYMCWPFTPW